MSEKPSQRERNENETKNENGERISENVYRAEVSCLQTTGEMRVFLYCLVLGLLSVLVAVTMTMTLTMGTRDAIAITISVR